MDMHFILQGLTARSISEVIKVTEVAEVAAPPVTKVIDMVPPVSIFSTSFKPTMATGLR